MKENIRFAKASGFRMKKGKVISSSKLQKNYTNCWPNGRPPELLGAFLSPIQQDS